MEENCCHLAYYCVTIGDLVLSFCGKFLWENVGHCLFLIYVFLGAVV